MALNGSAIAIDIETVSPDIEDPNLQNPDHVELLCIGVGYSQGPESPVETHVLFRREQTPESELELLYRLYEWVRTHISDYLLTYNGTKFDLLHLRGRADRAERAAGVSVEARDWVDAITGVHTHRDLFIETCDLYDEWIKLEEACRRLDIPVSETEHDGEVTDNMSIPDLGRRFLQGDSDVFGTLINYTEGDIEPLFELAEEIDD